MTLQNFLIITEKKPRDVSASHNYFTFHEHIINSIALCIFGSASENLPLILARNNVHIDQLLALNQNFYLVCQP